MNYAKSFSRITWEACRYCASLVGLSLAGLVAIANAGQTVHVMGTIDKVNLLERTVTVDVENQPIPIDLEIIRKSKIFSRGVAASPDAIKVGDKAKIKYDRELMAVVSIEVNFAVTPSNLEELNSSEKDYEPTVSRDGLEIFWAVETPDKKSTIWYANRKSPETVFGERKPFYSGHAPVLSADALQIYFRNNEGDAISWASRKSRDDDFTRPMVVASLSLRALDPIPTWLTDDGLSLYLDLAHENATKTTDHKSCYVAKRDSTASEWQPPMIVDAEFDGMPSDFHFCAATSSPDNLNLYCVSNLGLGVLSRKSPTGPFTHWSEIKIDTPEGQPIYCPRFQYVAATHELFLASNNLFSIPAMKKKRWMDLWVIKGFQPSSVQ